MLSAQLVGRRQLLPWVCAQIWPGVPHPPELFPNPFSLAGVGWKCPLGHWGAQTLFPCHKEKLQLPSASRNNSSCFPGSLCAAAFIGLRCLFDVTRVEQFVIGLREVTIEGWRCWTSLVIFYFPPADKQVSVWKLEKEKCAVILFSLLCSNYFCGCSKCFTVALKLLDLMPPQWNRILE